MKIVVAYPIPLLTILFVGLKLGGVIDWNWVWVLSPMWIAFFVGVLIYLSFSES